MCVLCCGTLWKEVGPVARPSRIVACPAFCRTARTLGVRAAGDVGRVVAGAALLLRNLKTQAFPSFLEDGSANHYIDSPRLASTTKDGGG